MRQLVFFGLLVGAALALSDAALAQSGESGHALTFHFCPMSAPPSTGRTQAFLEPSWLP